MASLTLATVVPLLTNSAGSMPKARHSSTISATRVRSAATAVVGSATGAGSLRGAGAATGAGFCSEGAGFCAAGAEFRSAEAGFCAAEAA